MYSKPSYSDNHQNNYTPVNNVNQYRQVNPSGPVKEKYIINQVPPSQQSNYGDKSFSPNNSLTGSYRQGDVINSISDNNFSNSRNP